jgi:Zn-dependent protease
MQNGWRVGSIFNIPLYIDPTWFLIVGWMTLRDGMEWQQRWGAPAAYSAGLAMAILLFTSVLLHELGHSLVAKAQGINVNSITLFLFGGVATIESESKTPGKMFQVAIAGPLVSLALALITGAIVMFAPIITSETPPLANQVLYILLSRIAGLNLVLTLFNLVPGLPLDGGQILKAAMWKRTGSFVKGTLIAARSGRFLGYAISALGLADVFGITRQFGLPEVGGLWAVLIGSFMVRNADRYTQVANLQQILIDLKAQDVMSRDFRVLDGNWNLRQFADHAIVAIDEPGAYFAAADGRYRGRVDLGQVQTIERSLWESKTLNAIAQPLNAIPSVTETTALTQVINLLEQQSDRAITVLSPAGSVAGMIDRSDIIRVVAGKLGFSLSEETLQQIKDSGTYPPGLQLASIAQSAQEI